ncbi:hypothetical protein ACFYYD_06315 [Streptomyces bluensis]|uniref:hypothetical protein n=1 Tax=Streptomyces bluensis TaxID=33897 RepID=UPI0036CE7335
MPSSRGDLLLRCVYGLRVSLLVGLAAALTGEEIQFDWLELPDTRIRGGAGGHAHQLCPVGRASGAAGSGKTADPLAPRGGFPHRSTAASLVQLDQQAVDLAAKLQPPGRIAWSS